MKKLTFLLTVCLSLLLLTNCGRNEETKGNAANPQDATQGMDGRMTVEDSIVR